MITPAQIRAARHLLVMKQDELAELAGISIATLKRAESEREVPISEETIQLIKDTLEVNGIIFLDMIGVRLRG
jgi:transcriptional regulator with XRE-family HTH domain